MAPGYGALIVARFIAGIPHGAYFGVAALVAAAMVSRYVPFIAAGNASPRRELGVFRRLQVWVTLLMVSVGFGGLFAVYTYATPTLLEVTKVSPAALPVLLAMTGVGMTVGNLVGGWFADRSRLWTIFGAA